MSILKEKAQVIMLPTKDKTNINLFKNNISITPVILSNKFGETEVSKSQHLYIISDEEIKVGDYISDGYIVWKWNDDSSLLGRKKVIATTDTSISKPEKGYNWNSVVYPQPSQGFIEKYIKEYNKGNIITDIIVEYEEILKCYRCGKTEPNCVNTSKNCIGSFGGFKQLKVSSDNTITMYSIKNSWTREEVMEIIHRLKDLSVETDFWDADEWIKENL